MAKVTTVFGLTIQFELINWIFFSLPPVLSENGPDACVPRNMSCSYGELVKRLYTKKLCSKITFCSVKVSKLESKN